ncbi:SEC-INDEPENDENT PROTEIN TRANSLOCASE PROTEIN TATA CHLOROPLASTIC [Salix purpurea]|uniref:SEC-INDEPENDENT PROTEIN TRANSLOCASE PROTEIN TATA CHLOROPLASTIC n=1 Tax=Salix purpurea TaxID=77065 RepID=A0A9Q0VFN2_SALPP|nr:SEC-INDEPENDENT PROTEIN TRANSLOCASE PROTEIN TATA CHLOROPLASTIC [Salix purpurea]
MASLISTSASLCSTSTSTQSALYLLSPSPLIPYPKAPKLGLSTWTSQLCLGPFSHWSGLKHLGISFSPNFVTKERKGRCRGKVIRASLFGVGAPEALVIGVVALLVFGPKGLAEVARNLGKTLREFQPTIKELQEVSREFKSTLEREIGLDEISSQTQNTYSSKITNTASNPSSAGSTNISPTVTDPNGAPSPNRAYTSEEYLKITEEQLKASAAEQQGQSTPPVESQLEPENQLRSQVPVKETAGAMPPPEKPENEAQNS